VCFHKISVVSEPQDKPSLHNHPITRGDPAGTAPHSRSNTSRPWDIDLVSLDLLERSPSWGGQQGARKALGWAWAALRRKRRKQTRWGEASCMQAETRTVIGPEPGYCLSIPNPFLNSENVTTSAGEAGVTMSAAGPASRFCC